jgi:hypothetical protein
MFIKHKYISNKKYVWLNYLNYEITIKNVLKYSAFYFNTLFYFEIIFYISNSNTQIFILVIVVCFKNVLKYYYCWDYFYFINNYYTFLHKNVLIILCTFYRILKKWYFVYSEKHVIHVPLLVHYVHHHHRPIIKPIKHKIKKVQTKKYIHRYHYWL